METLLTKIGAQAGLDASGLADALRTLSVPDVQAAFAKIRTARAKGRKAGVVFASVVAVVAVAVIVASRLPQGQDLWVGISAGILATVFAYCLASVMVFSPAQGGLRAVAIPRLFSAALSGSHAAGADYAPDYGPFVAARILPKFDSVEREQDSFWFTHSDGRRKVDVRGVEATMVRRVTDAQGKTRQEASTRVVVRCDYPDATTPFEKDVRVRTESAPARVFGLARLPFPALVALVVVAFLVAPVLGIVGAVILGVSRSGAYGKIAGAKDVRLENVDFEKRFQVLSEDQIYARMVMTPDVMDGFARFARKARGRYEFLFTGKALLVVRAGAFLDKTDLQNDVANVRMLLSWFAELKEVAALVKETGILAFSKAEGGVAGSGLGVVPQPVV